jgi:hypothetical protein
MPKVLHFLNKCKHLPNQLFIELQLAQCKNDSYAENVSWIMSIFQLFNTLASELVLALHLYLLTRILN